MVSLGGNDGMETGIDTDKAPTKSASKSGKAVFRARNIPIGMIAPLRNTDIKHSPWEGDCEKKPWDYRVTALIPVLDTWEMVGLVIELLRLQTERPYIILVDTGSTPENLARIQSYAAEDCEVHSLRLNGVSHPSDFPCFACDIGHTLCRTAFLFHTHADVFLRKRTVLEEMLALCQNNPVVGYQISPRPHRDWVGMVGHSCMMYHVPTIDSHGISWSMRRICGYYDVEWRPCTSRPNWPDTEVGFNVLCREAGIVPTIIGTEENFQRNVTEHFDHCRSATSAVLYSPAYWTQCQKWLESAMREARQRIAEWS